MVIFDDDDDNQYCPLTYDHPHYEEAFVLNIIREIPNFRAIIKSLGKLKEQDKRSRAGYAYQTAHNFDITLTFVLSYCPHMITK